MNNEQRLFNRINTHVLIDVGEDVNSPTNDFEATCVDLSSGGMKILLPVELKVGSYVLVTCVLDKNIHGEFFLETQAVVRWCGGEKGSSVFAAGLEFEFISEEAVAEIDRLTHVGRFL